MTEITIYNVQRAIYNSESKKTMSSARHLTAVYISVKFHENTSNIFF